MSTSKRGSVLVMGSMTGGGALEDENEEDLYSGYNDFPSALNTDDLAFDSNFQVSAASTRRPTALATRGGLATPLGTGASRLGTAAGFKRDSLSRTGIWTRGGTGRPITGADGLNRPMTAVRGAGYTASGRQTMDSLGGPSLQKKPIPSMTPKHEDTLEERVKVMEEKITSLIEDSVLASCGGDPRRGLDLAKEAGNKEKALMKMKESAGSSEGHDWDLTFSVLFNLAVAYENADMLPEALATYSGIVKNKLLASGPKVKINMGNIFVRQGHPQKAVKMYRMAMDQLNTSHKDLRLKLMHNMGIIFLKMGNPSDAAASFEYIMQEKASFKTGLHLVVAAFLSGDPAKMKRAFGDLLAVKMEVEEDEDKYGSGTDSDDPVSQLLMEVLKNDKLRKHEKETRLYAERAVLSAARLIAPAVESSLAEGYNWVTEEIRGSRLSQLAHALEISKALVFLKQGELTEATQILKSFEKKETKVATAAATNLSFVFFLQGDLENAEAYATAASKADFYNSLAYVNLGNVHFLRQDWEEAKKCYSEAIGIDAACIEALYNLGLANQVLKFYEEALECFHKVQSLVRNHPHVTYQLARTHELRGEVEVAMEWYFKALALVPSDAGLLKKLASLSDMEGDRTGAFQYYYDSHRYDPSDTGVIEWLINYLLEMQMPEKAVVFCQKAQLLQPEEPKWAVGLGSAYRRMGNYSQALQTFQKVYKNNPENHHALGALVKLSTDMGLKEAETYRDALSRLERAQENQRFNSSMSRGSAQAPVSRYGAPSRMGSSRAGQQQPHPSSSTSSFDDNRSEHNSDYGGGGGMTRGSAGGGGGYLDDIQPNEGLLMDDLDSFSSPIGGGGHHQRASGRGGRPRTAAVVVDELTAFFEENEVGADVLPI